MKGIALVVLCGGLLGVIWTIKETLAVPKCLKAGYNANDGCTPYAANEGWYSFCYVYRGQWIAYPYRCGFADPTNVTMGYKEFDGTKCVEVDEASTCEAKGGDPPKDPPEKSDKTNWADIDFES